METYDFKYKKGDIVVVTRKKYYWGDYSDIITRICIVLDSHLSYAVYSSKGAEGEKEPWYNLTYDLQRGYYNNRVDHIATDETIKPLSEYWYINEELEVCKETDVKLDTKFIHRANSFGIFLTEDKAKSVIRNFKYKNIIYNLI